MSGRVKKAERRDIRRAFGPEAVAGLEQLRKQVEADHATLNTLKDRVDALERKDREQDKAIKSLEDLVLSHQKSLEFLGHLRDDERQRISTWQGRFRFLFTGR